MTRIHLHPRLRQRGAASLVVAMILLFGMTMVAFYANRGLLFEQKTSANQYRATSAFEVAEAGLEWATARLNEPQKIDTACAPSAPATDKTFRDTVPADTQRGHRLQSGHRHASPGCRIPAERSRWPAVARMPATRASGRANDRTFAVEFSLSMRDPESVEIRSTAASRTRTSLDGAALRTQSRRFGSSSSCSPRFASHRRQHSPPAATSTLGTSTVNIVNTDSSTNGITVNAGQNAHGVASRVTSLPGLPPEASVVANDTSLSALNTADPTGNAIFRSYFGQSMADYKADPRNDGHLRPGVYGICATGAIVLFRRPGLRDGSRQRHRERRRTQFWVDAAARVHRRQCAGSLGTANNPVLLVSPYAITFTGSTPVFGLLFGAHQTWNVSGGGTPQVHGALITRDDFNSSGNLTLIYDAGVLRKLRPATGSMVRVPGSWRDFSL